MRPPANDGTLPFPNDAAAARDAGMAAAESARGADQDKLVIDQCIRFLASTGLPFSSNDVRQRLPVVSGALIGCRFMAAARRGEIVRVGDTLANHRAGHARRISVWRGA